ncbi:MAG: hypothetical protein N2746_07190 [Deltaproteobacteria bacterium]|nr:hypothetical protein [Deltaproteobacteria bacterium]
MHVDIIKSKFEQIIKRIILEKDKTINDLYANLTSTFSKSEIEHNEIERIINNYEAICGEYIRKGRKRFIEIFNYLNKRFYQNIRPELLELNNRLDRISKKMQKVQRLTNEQGK